jgi:protein involved in polysaccharide export with SLBB domain
MFVGLWMSEHLEKATCWMAILIVLTFTALCPGCRGSLPVFTSEPDLPVLGEEDSRTARAKTAAPDSPFKRYVTQAGDLIKIVFVDATPTFESRVDKGGTVTLPFLGKFLAAGKAFEELHSELVAADPRYRGPVLSSCDCLEYYVVDEVKAPGTKSYAGRTTVSKAVSASGGFTKFANKETGILLHSDGRTEIINLASSIKSPTADPPVFPGDKITVTRLNGAR